MNLSQLRIYLVLMVVLLLGACSKGQSANGGHGSMPPPAVDVVTAHSQTVVLTQSVTGRLAPTKIAQVRARVTGIVLKRTYKEGSEVKQGQQLFQIDPATLQATLNLQEAALEQAKASAQNARETAARDRKLHAKGLLSPQALDNALATERTSEAAVHQAEANVKLARLNLDYADVTAPISGIAEEAQVTEGALVSQSSGTLMTTIDQINPLYVNFSLPSDEVGQLEAAANAYSQNKDDSKSPGSIRLSQENGKAYPEAGQLDYIGPTVNADTGTISLRGVIPNKKHQLLPGMFVNLEVVTGQLKNAFVLPQAAIQRDDRGAYVLTVDSNNKVGRTNVETHNLQDGNWVVTGPLKDGEKVIVEGVQKTKPGGTVKPQPMKSNNSQSKSGS